MVFISFFFNSFYHLQVQHLNSNRTCVMIFFLIKCRATVSFNVDQEWHAPPPSIWYFHTVVPLPYDDTSWHTITDMKNYWVRLLILIEIIKFVRFGVCRFFSSSAAHWTRYDLRNFLPWKKATSTSLFVFSTISHVKKVIKQATAVK